MTNRADDGSATSLRAAIDQVNGGAAGDTWRIQLDGGGDPFVIDRDCQSGNPDDNHGGDLDIVAHATVTIETAPPLTAFAGSPPMATVEVRCPGERVVHVLGGGTLVISSLRVTGGNTANGADAVGPNPSGGAGEQGGAILSTGNVQLLRSRFDGNRTGDGGRGLSGVLTDGGFGGFGGAGAVVRTDGQITVDGSTFVGNRTGNGGPGGSAVGVGAEGGRGGFGGQAMLLGSTVKIESSLFRDNALGDGGNGGNSGSFVGGEGGRGGSGTATVGSADIVGSTFTGNVAGSGGRGGTGGVAGGDGGQGGVGGAIAGDAGLSLLMVTIDGNAAGAGGSGGTGPTPGVPGAPGEGGGLFVGAVNVIEFSTITNNHSANAGANIATSGPGTSLHASIVGDPQGGGANCSGPTQSFGSNVFGGDASCAATASDLGLPSPLPVGPLADNGGRTIAFSDGGDPMPTRMPLPGGAIDELLDPASCTAVPVDQRLEIKPSGGCEPGSVEVPVASASRYVPLPPARVFDTRSPGPLAGRVPADGTITVQFAGVAGVPADASAVAFNLTLTQATGAGFVTAYPAGSPLPLASNLNAVRAGQDVPNFVVVPLGADGSVSFYSFAGGHLLADIAGYFVPAQVATAGRLVAEEPYRIVDTRLSGNKLAPGASLTLSLDDLEVDVPGDSLAVVLNVTGTEADGAGYVTAYPTGQAQPYTSTLNLDGPAHTAANMAIVPIGADRSITFFSDAGTQLIVDVTGYVTGPSSRTGTWGLTVPLDPVRVFDTRAGGVGAPVPAGGSIDVPTAGVAGIPAATDGLLLNVTAADSLAPGYVTSWPTGAERPVASTLNVTAAGEERANAALAEIGDGGAVSYFAETGTHLLADAFGYLVPFSGARLPSP